MPTAWKGLGTVLGELLAPLMNGCIGNAQVTGHLRDRLPTGLNQLHRFALKLCCVGLLNFLHDPVLLLKEYILSFHSSTNPGRSRMDSKKPDGAQAGQSPSEQQAFFLVPMQESDCSLARSAPVLPAWSGSRGTWTACLLTQGKQARRARCSLATTLSAGTASPCSSSSLEHDALCWPASFRLPRAGLACAGKGRRESACETWHASNVTIVSSSATNKRFMNKYYQEWLNLCSKHEHPIRS